MKSAITRGEILLEDYLIPMGISQNALARAVGISPRSINEIVLARQRRSEAS
jgi:addiction module HigA family antidote